jgi:negative regulator of flagellin synthesis FlgM
MSNTIQTNHQNTSGLLGPISTGPTAAGPVRTPVQGSPAPVTVRADQATVSTIGTLVAKASEGSDVRYDKVAALQSAISSGSYNVSSSAVAGKIVDSLVK